jgi:hypothetical protein
MKTIFVLAPLCLIAGMLPAADYPQAEIGNGVIRAKIYLPDANNGFYRGTRFDWSGVIYSLQYKGHDYYGPWFTKTAPNIRDFVFEGPDIIAGPCSGVTGPADEFRPLGWDEAKAGGTFVKIGVGALRKPGEGRYDNYHVYEIADPGKRSVRRNPDSIEFTQQLSDASSGYGYVYRKVVRLVPGKPEMVLEHSLKNTGKNAIRTTVYNHNFLVLDKQTTGPEFTITVPFQIRTQRPPKPELAEVRGNRIAYLKPLEGRDVVMVPIEGFGQAAADSEFRVENSKLGAGVKIIADRPLLSETLWSIRSVISMEPFTAIAIEPGGEFTWKSTYTYYTLPSGRK